MCFRFGTEIKAHSYPKQITPLGKNNISRIAGLLYLVVVITGIFSLAYVPKQLFVWDNPAQTFDNIATHETLFRASIASSAICYTAFIFLPIALFQLLKTVDRLWAGVMAVLAIVSVPVSFSNLQNKYNILSLLESTRQSGTPPLPELQQQTMKYLTQYDNGILVATIFWGLWLLPFGYLVYKSGFLPKALGVLLMLGCLGYVVNYFGNTLSANYGALGVSSYFGMLPSIGEIGACLWLLLIGAKENKQL